MNLLNLNKIVILLIALCSHTAFSKVDCNLNKFEDVAESLGLELADQLELWTTNKLASIKQEGQQLGTKPGSFESKLVEYRVVSDMPESATLTYHFSVKSAIGQKYVLRHYYQPVQIRSFLGLYFDTYGDAKDIQFILEAHPKYDINTEIKSCRIVLKKWSTGPNFVMNEKNEVGYRLNPEEHEDMQAEMTVLPRR